MTRARVAIVGLGRMGSTIDDEGHTHLPYAVAAATAASDRLELVAGCDLDAGRRATFAARWDVAAVYDDMVRMVEVERPDLVAVCTRAAGTDQRAAPSPDYRVDLHADLAVTLAELGVPMLYVEKAMACSMRGADRVRDAVHSAGAAFNTGVLRRFDNRYDVVRDAVLAGRIGTPKVALHYAPSTLLHGHIHSIDTLSWLLGDPAITHVRGELEPRDTVIVGGHLAADPRATYQLRFAGGVEAWSVPAAYWEFEVIGTEGVVRSLHNGAGAELRVAVEGGGGWEPAELSAVEPWSTTRCCLEDLVRARDTGLTTRGHVDVTHHITEATLAVAESHRRGGGWIELPGVDRNLYVFHV